MNRIDAAVDAGHSNTDEGLARTLIGGIWGFDAWPSEATSKLFEFCKSQINLLRPNELVIRCDQDIVDIVKFVRDERSKTLSVLQAKLELERPPWLGSSSKAPLELAVRLGFLVKPEQLCDEEAIVSALHALFPQSQDPRSVEKIDHHFNERSLRKVGFTIMRTSYLSDHLLLDHPTRTVWLFEQTEFLRSYKDDGDRPIYPEGLLEETTETIRLLGADGDATKLGGDLLAWNTAQSDIEMGLGKPASLDINKYHFWRDRLAALHEAYRKAKPTSLKQWWHDRRDSSQWTTFWLAVVAILLTLLFGLIQSVTGVIQAVAAYHGQPCHTS